MQGWFRLVVFTLFSVCLSINTFAQKGLPKYENVYKDAMTANNADVAYAVFTDYLLQVPDAKRANPYYQAGILAYQKAKTIHPIYNHTQYVTLRNKADDYLRICIEFINEEEVKRDAAMYQGIAPAERKPVYAEIQEYINKVIDTNRVEKRKILNVYEAYEGVTRNYNICQSNYYKLCERFVTIKDMYFTFDNDLTKALNDMKESYDSTQYYLKTYADLVSKADIRDFNANYTEQKIETYRLDGLSPLNFTKPQNVLWDYHSWADRLLKNSDKFAGLFQEVIDLDEDLTTRLNSFNSNRNLSDNYLAIEVDNVLLDSLRIFGYYPALNRVINYKEEKLKYLIQSRRRINTPTAENSDDQLITKLQYYDNLLNNYVMIDSMYQALDEYYKNDSLAYQSANFADQAEFAQYLQDEKLENDTEYNFTLDNINKYNVNLQNLIRNDHVVTYRRQDLPLYLGQGFYRSSAKGVITKCVKPIEASRSFYLSGSVISSDGFALAYVALCTDENTVSWMKTIDIGRVIYDNCAMSVSPTADGGCFALIIAKNVSDPSLITNTIIQYDAKGNEIKRFLLPEKTLGIGRTIEYIEHSNRILLSFHAEDENWYSKKDKLIIQELDAEFNQVFRAELNFNGELTHVINGSNGNVLLLGNYFEITDQNGTDFKAANFGEENAGSAIFSALIGSDGKVKKINHYTPKESSYLMTAQRIKSNRIVLIGQKGGLRKNNALPYNDDAPLMYLTIDLDGNLQNRFEKATK